MGLDNTNHNFEKKNRKNRFPEKIVVIKIRVPKKMRVCFEGAQKRALYKKEDTFPTKKKRESDALNSVVKYLGSSNL